MAETRGSLRFTTNFAGAAASTWTRTASRLDLAPGRYDIRVAAAGTDQSAGSVFTEVTVPDFRAELAVGGLSVGADTGMPVTAADRARGVLPLIPFASNELAPGTQAAAQLPISVAENAASQPLTIVATLTAPDGTTHPLDRTVGVGRDYASRGGRVHKVLLPPALAAGPHRLVVESTLGRTTVVRELTLTVLPSPCTRSRRCDLPRAGSSPQLPVPSNPVSLVSVVACCYSQPPLRPCTLVRRKPDRRLASS